MMNDQNFFLITAKTAAKKFGTYLAIGLTGLTMWFGTEGILSWREYRHSQIPIMLEQIKAEQKVVRSRNELSNKLDGAVSNYDYNGAIKIIDQIRSQGIFNLEEISQMEAKVEEASEEGLYKKIKNSPKERKLSEDYLRIFSEGKHRKKVIEEILFYDFSNFLESLELQGDINESTRRLVTLNSSLEKYSNDQSDLLKTSLELLVKKSDQYISKDVFSERVLELGSRVRVGKPDKSEWNSSYYEQRQKTIPINSTGTIINFSNGKYFIKFDIDKYFWEMEWDELRNYWKGGKKNVASYVLEELFSAPSTEIEKIRFKSELETLKSYIQK